MVYGLVVLTAFRILGRVAGRCSSRIFQNTFGRLAFQYLVSTRAVIASLDLTDCNQPKAVTYRDVCEDRSSPEATARST